MASIIGLAAIESIREAWAIANRTSDLSRIPVQARADELSWAGDNAGALRVFRSHMRPDDDFVLVFGRGADETLLRLLTHSYLYPAVEVSAVDDPHVIIGFGEGARPPTTPDLVVGDAWLLRRSR
jgi:hypothetical protein